MLFRPTNVIPSTLSGLGDGVIDVNDGLNISWQVNGDSPMTAYQIVVYQNDTGSTQVYDTGKVTLASPFYGSNQLGVLQTFSANEITASELSSAGIVNGYTNGYKYVITQWYSETESVTQTSANVFITRDTPTIAFDSIPNPLASRTINVTATYTQAQGDAISWARWMLADKSDLTDPISDTGNINTSLLQFSYDGLFSGTTYSIRLIVQTQNGVTVDTGWTDFAVSYSVAPSDGLVNVCKRGGAPFVEITWTNRTAIQGSPTGDYTAIGGLLRIPSGSSVTWADNQSTGINFPPEWSFVWRGQIAEYAANGNAVAVLGSESGDFKIIVSQSSIQFVQGSTVIFNQAVSLKVNDWIVVVVTADHFYLKQVTYEGGLLPATNLYPSTNLFPEPVSQKINNFDGAISYTQTDIQSITLNGQQTAEYIWLYSGSFSETTINNLVGGEWFEPGYDANTYLIATFQNGLLADITGGNGDTLFGASIYRREIGNNYLQHVVDVDAGYLIARDYGAKSQTAYEYIVWQRGGETYTSAPYQSEQIKPLFNFFTLIECQKDDTQDNVYRVINAYKLAGNVNTGSISNNNNPMIFQNFTQYPGRQPVPQLYKSGILTALIGSINQSQTGYEDSWQLADELSALSLSMNPKFLRDMKGAIWKVETSAAISTQVSNTSYAQPITISIPWVEVGDSERVSIVATPSDPIWETDQIVETQVYIDISTGCLMWTTPDGYQGSTLTLNEAGELIQTGTGYIEPANMYIDKNGYLIATVGE